MGIGPDDYLFKPSGENSGRGLAILPSQYSNNTQSVDIVDQNGNVLDSGRYRHPYESGGGIWDFSKPGGSYGSGTQTRITLEDGSQVYFPGGGGRYEGNVKGASGDPLSGDSLGGSSLGTSPGGNPFVIPGGVDFSQIMPPTINFGSAWDFAMDIGEGNKQKFYENLNSDETKNSALGLVDTDVKGIMNAANTLVPFVRGQGDLDTTTNIKRAGTIDDFNFERTPRFNRENRQLTKEANEFNRSEREASIEASGLDYRDRITKLLDDLEIQATGTLPSRVLDKLQTTTSRDRGADIASATGAGSASSTSRDIQDKLDIGTRLQLLTGAQAAIPGVLTNAQAVLQPPEERTPTIYNQPTGVPLNPSNIADRLPVTSNVSAGAAQSQIGTQATEYQTIPATTALATNLDSQKFNANGQFMRDQFVYGAQQAQITARDSAVQGAINQDKADYQFEAGLDQRRDSELLRAGTSLAGSVLGPLLSTPTGSNPIIDGIRTGASNLGGMVVDGIGAVVGAASSGADALFGNNDGAISVGSTRIDSDSFRNGVNSIGEFFTGPTASRVASSGMSDGVSGGVSGASSQVNAFRDAMEPISNVGVDAKVVAQAGTAVANWNRMSPGQQLNSVSQIATSVLENKGIIGQSQASSIRYAGQAISTLADPNSSDGQRASAVTSALGNSLAYQYSGPVDNPTSIGNSAVTGRTTIDGKPAFTLSDGSVVPQSTLINSDNAVSALNAFNVLTGSGTRQDKVTALTALGIDAATTNDIIGQVEGGNTLAGLQLFNTVAHWDEMNPIQQAAVTMQTSNTIFNAIDQTLNSGAQAGSSALNYLPGLSSSGLSAATSSAATAGAEMAGNAVAGSVVPTLSQTIGTYLAGAGGVAGVVLGIHQAADTIDAVSDMPRSKAVGTGVIGGASSGLSTGIGVGSFLGGPVLGGLIGLGVGVAGGLTAGLTASGKNSGQMERDAWRENLEAVGFATRDKEGHKVTLADGSQYNIGIDGSNKLVNKDGSERNTFDVDWNNKVAVDSIPDAHLFAIMSGLDPTSNSKFDTFHRAVSQSLNAATSNTDSAQGVKDNFKAMMPNVDPRLAAFRVETLRLANKISDQEYGVYLDKINDIYGTQITPTDRTKASDSVVRMIRQSGDKASKQDKDLLSLLTNPDKLSKAERELKARMERDSKNQ